MKLYICRADIVMGQLYFSNRRGSSLKIKSTLQTFVRLVLQAITGRERVKRKTTLQTERFSAWYILCQGSNNKLILR